MYKFLRYNKPYVNNTFHIVISYLSTYSLQTAVLSHCLVGPTASAKTKCYQVLTATLTHLKGQISHYGQHIKLVYIRIYGKS